MITGCSGFHATALRSVLRVEYYFNTYALQETKLFQHL